MKADWFSLPIESAYKCRFIPERDSSEIVNLYHLALVPLSGTGKRTKYDRMVWASNAYAKEHPEVTANGAYKDLCGILGF